MDTNTQIYILRDEQQHGPYSPGVAEAMLKDGSLSPDDLAWHDGMAEWQPLAGLLQPAPQPQGRQSHQGWMAALLGVFAVLGVGLKLLEQKPEESDSSGKKSKPGAVDRLFDSSEHRAKNNAVTLVRNRLKAPSTATFAEPRIVKAEHPWYQVYVVVDAQNGFGAMIRNRFLCVLRLEEGSKFTWNEEFSVMEADEETLESSTFLEGMRYQNNWPGAKDPFSGQ